jgi:hypothetical protein
LVNVGDLVYLSDKSATEWNISISVAWIIGICGPGAHGLLCSWVIVQYTLQKRASRKTFLWKKKKTPRSLFLCASISAVHQNKQTVNWSFLSLFVHVFLLHRTEQNSDFEIST